MPKINSPTRSNTNRRMFVQATAGLSGAALGYSALVGANAEAAEQPELPPIVQPGNTILFQGDSITDSGRNRVAADKPNQQPPLGTGYAWLAAAALLVDRAEDDLQIYNRGISGNKVFQLAERWQEDCLNLQPDVLSILIGVNDIWHKLNGKYDGSVEKYERDFAALIERTKAALPEVKLVVCEPFVLRCGAVDGKWFPAFDGYLAAARRVSKASGATLVPFQRMFNLAIQHAPPEHWAADGVHPTPAGAALMAHCWLRTIGACG